MLQKYKKMTPGLEVMFGVVLRVQKRAKRGQRPSRAGVGKMHIKVNKTELFAELFPEQPNGCSEYRNRSSTFEIHVEMLQNSFELLLSSEIASFEIGS